jgi:hypothetical protein
MMPDDQTNPTPTNDPMPASPAPMPATDDQTPMNTTGVEQAVNDPNLSEGQRDEATAQLAQGILPEDQATTPSEDLQEVAQDSQAVDSDPDNTAPADVVPGDEKDGND